MRKEKKKVVTFAELNILTINIKKDRLSLHLDDGRIISFPINAFPEIQKMLSAKRKEISITGEKYFNIFLIGNSNHVYVLSKDLMIIRE
ncbi:MAG: DUF2442 domain-containing protein [Leptospiraceae bacterium]|nr:hypothetical protein [Leptospiraceae bacterium]MCK6382423.1 DUF2442 domain-containing protein [Leptospiraceae bacterium]